MIETRLVWHSTAERTPKSGGTKAVVYLGVVAWMYWNPDGKTWHPINGWRKNLGQPADTVSLWAEIERPRENA